MATANELRRMKPEELGRMLADQRGSLFNLRLQLRTGHLESTALLCAARKDIARLHTVVREAGLGITRPQSAMPELPVETRGKRASTKAKAAGKSGTAKAKIAKNEDRNG